MEVLCPKCKSYSLEFENIATDIDSGKLTMVDETYCCTCEHQFTTISYYELKHIKNEIVEESE